MKISACVLQRFAGIVTATLVAPLLLSGCGNSNVSEDSSSLEEMTYLQEEAVKTNSVFTSGEFTLYYTNASHTAIYETVKDYDFQGWSTEAIVEQVLADLVNVDWVETEDKNVEAVSIVPFKQCGGGGNSRGDQFSEAIECGWWISCYWRICRTVKSPPRSIFCR